MQQSLFQQIESKCAHKNHAHCCKVCDLWCDFSINQFVEKTSQWRTFKSCSTMPYSGRWNRPKIERTFKNCTNWTTKIEWTSDVVEENDKKRFGRWSIWKCFVFFKWPISSNVYLISSDTKDFPRIQDDQMTLIQQKITKLERMTANLQKNFKTLNSKLEMFPSAVNIFQNVCISNWRFLT